MSNLPIAYKRTEIQRKEDFVRICELRTLGKTWQQVTDILNSERGYHCSMQAYYNHYYRELKKEVAERQPKIELERHIDELEWVISQATQAWIASSDVELNVTEKGWADADTGKIIKPYKVIQTLQGRGNPRFLDIILKAMEKRADLLDLNKPKEFNINHFLREHGVDDEFGNKMNPITSEDILEIESTDATDRSEII